MQRIIWSMVAVALMVGATAPTAMAQRDAGAKARGEFGYGFWNQPRTQRYYTPYYVVRPETQATRSFSYEPIGVYAGDHVAIAVDHAKMMSGKKQVGTLDRGQVFEVRKVTNGWLLAELNTNGEALRGWVWHDNTRAEPEPPPAPPTQE